jgi:hypothetical protein
VSAWITGLTSTAVNTKSPVVTAVPSVIGWMLMPVATPIAGGTVMPSSRIASERVPVDVARLHGARLPHGAVDVRPIDRGGRPRGGNECESECKNKHENLRLAVVHKK